MNNDLFTSQVVNIYFWLLVRKHEFRVFNGHLQYKEFNQIGFRPTKNIDYLKAYVIK